MADIKITKDTPEKEILKIGEKCGECGKCCSFGSGMLLESEISRIANFLKVPTGKFKEDFLEETEIFHTKVFKIKSFKKENKPYGPCMFLEENKCKIHEVKPLHCKVGNCEERGDDLHVWYMVNYLFNPFDPESVRQYNSYIKTGGRLIPSAELENFIKDKTVLKQILNYERLL